MEFYSLLVLLLLEDMCMESCQIESQLAPLEVFET